VHGVFERQVEVVGQRSKRIRRYANNGPRGGRVVDVRETSVRMIAALEHRVDRRAVLGFGTTGVLTARQTFALAFPIRLRQAMATAKP